MTERKQIIVSVEIPDITENNFKLPKFEEVNE